MKVNIKKIIVIAVALILAINLSSFVLITQINNSSTNSNNPLFSHNPPFDPYSSGLVLDDLNIDEAVLSNSENLTHLECHRKKTQKHICPLLIA